MPKRAMKPLRAIHITEPLTVYQWFPDMGATPGLHEGSPMKGYPTLVYCITHHGWQRVIPGSWVINDGLAGYRVVDPEIFDSFYSILDNAETDDDKILAGEEV